MIDKKPATPPSKIVDLAAYRAENYPEKHRWKGPGEPPAKWVAADGTIIYRSYADYCSD